MRKAIIIGLDGLEPKIVEYLINKGDLPNLKRISEQGGYSRICTTSPAQTPVAWSTFMTGVNPGGHGIFDFLSRDAKTYLPVLNLTRYEQKNAFVPPKAVNVRRGTPVWKLLTNAGLPSIILRCPCTYPPDNILGKMLSGVGVPDLRGGLGTSTFYTSKDDVKPENAEKLIFISPNGDKASTFIIGPRDPKTFKDITVDIKLEIDRLSRKVIIHSDSRPNALEVIEGSWSEWLKVKFKIGLFQSVKGIVRFYLRQIEPYLELYASPLNFDPEAPLFPISSPTEYSSEIQARMGAYYTLGMAEDHDGLIHGRFDEEAFLQQSELVLHERESMMFHELDRLKEGLFFCVVDTPDRLQHMFWRFQEPDHPANRNSFSLEMAGVIGDHYRALDSMIGKVMEYVDESTLLAVLSDHGMNSFQRGLNLNTWLYENDFLALKKGIKPGEEENDDFFRNVDWSKTRAYALGLGGIFLNVNDREENGIVGWDDVESIKSALVKGLTGLVDPERRKMAIRSVVSREQIYTGPYVNEAPDLLVNFSEGYRVSWGTPLGGVPAGLFEDNVKRWGGDHVIDPNLIPGILFLNMPFDKKNVSMLDMAPTLLAALGLAKGSMMEGKNILI